MSPTTTGFAELEEIYLDVQLRGDCREALRFVDRLRYRCRRVPAQSSWPASKAGVGIAPAQVSRS